VTSPAAPTSPRFIGTEELGRALTKAESSANEKLLRAHDYPKQRIIALAFAFRLSRNMAIAEDVLVRADLQFVRLGWDPNKVSLVKCLCRIVWVEWAREKRERALQRHAEEMFLLNMQAVEAGTAPSPEDEVLAAEAHREDEAKRRGYLDRLRSMFVEARDQVNVEWMDYTAQEIDDLEEMARKSGRKVAEFYDAADRRKRAVKRLIAELRGVPSRKDD
jgi:hypothetical protein